MSQRDFNVGSTTSRGNLEENSGVEPTRPELFFPWRGRKKKFFFVHLVGLGVG